MKLTLFTVSVHGSCYTSWHTSGSFFFFFFFYNFLSTLFPVTISERIGRCINISSIIDYWYFIVFAYFIVLKLIFCFINFLLFVIWQISFNFQLVSNMCILSAVKFSKIFIKFLSNMRDTMLFLHNLCLSGVGDYRKHWHHDATSGSPTLCPEAEWVSRVGLRIPRSHSSTGGLTLLPQNWLSHTSSFHYTCKYVLNSTLPWLTGRVEATWGLSHTTLH